MKTKNLDGSYLNYLAAVMAIVMLAVEAVAQSIPPLINYQGRLTDQTGDPLASGLYGIQFRLWDSTTASNANDLIWDQQQSVTVQTNGVFNVILGSPGGSSIPGITPQVNNLAYAFNGSNCFLGITVTTSNSVPVTIPTEILPRQQLLSVPYAVSALVAVHALDGNAPGTIQAYGGSQPPKGYLLCDGSAYSSLVYSNLFMAIGTNWGIGSGTNNFSVPDLRGRSLFGSGFGGVDINGNVLTSRILAQIGGEEQHTLTIAEMPNHDHQSMADNSAAGGGYWSTGGNGAWKSYVGGNQPTYKFRTSLEGGGLPHNTMPPFAVVSFIIKY